MKVAITGRHFDVTDALKNYINAKLNRLDRFAQDIISAHVVLNLEKNAHVAEFNIKLKKSHINIVERNQNLYAAVDRAIVRLKKLLIRHEEKIKSHRHKKIQKQT